MKRDPENISGTNSGVGRAIIDPVHDVRIEMDLPKRDRSSGSGDVAQSFNP
jgi:hypothetical protein